MLKKVKATPTKITALEVWGYKSIHQRKHIELAPLTLLAGANSSGKSSMMQPVLLLKQTLEAGYDPGPLLLDGQHVRFSSVDQMISRKNAVQKLPGEFGVKLKSGTENFLEFCFTKSEGKPLELGRMSNRFYGELTELRPGLSSGEILERSLIARNAQESFDALGDPEPRFQIVRDRCNLLIKAEIKINGQATRGVAFSDPGVVWIEESFIRGLIHIPGLRGNPRRNYSVSAIGENFPGTFEAYTASMIAHWQTNRDQQKLKGLAADMQMLGLTSKVEARAINDAEVELLVGRLPNPPRRGIQDLVSIADVGFGVSQTLPVLVALHAAKKGQTVYLEQPEIHLHPKAQLALAEVLVGAIGRGVRVIVETHSAILLLGIQTLIAEDSLEADQVRLHWFSRNAKTGWTEITTAEVDETGAFGDWPVDFDEVSLAADNAYLTAAEKKLMRRSK